MPWLTVYENVELAVQQVFRKTMAKQERKDWINHNLELVNMATPPTSGRGRFPAAWHSGSALPGRWR